MSQRHSTLHKPHWTGSLLILLWVVFDLEIPGHHRPVHMAQILHGILPETRTDFLKILRHYNPFVRSEFFTQFDTTDHYIYMS